MMVCEFRAIVCSSCKIYQVKQVSNNNKFKCTVCSKTVTIEQEFFRGAARECREVVQSLNLARAHGEIPETCVASIGTGKTPTQRIVCKKPTKSKSMAENDKKCGATDPKKMSQSSVRTVELESDGELDEMLLSIEEPCEGKDVEAPPKKTDEEVNINKETPLRRLAAKAAESPLFKDAKNKFEELRKRGKARLSKFKFVAKDEEDEVGGSEAIPLSDITCSTPVINHSPDVRKEESPVFQTPRRPTGSQETPNTTRNALKCVNRDNSARKQGMRIDDEFELTNRELDELEEMGRRRIEKEMKLNGEERVCSKRKQEGENEMEEIDLNDSIGGTKKQKVEESPVSSGRAKLLATLSKFRNTPSPRRAS